MAPALVAVQLWLFVRYLKERAVLVAEAEPELTERQLVWAEICGHALLVPSLAVNLAFACRPG